MALGTPTSAGTSVSLGAVSSGSITLTAPSSSRVFVAAGGPTSASRTVSSVAGGSLTWAVGKAVTATGGFVEVWSADCPGGITSQSITVTLSGAILAGGILGWYETGVATSSPLDGTGASATTATPDTAWSTTSGTTTNADDVLYAVAMTDNAGACTSTPSGTVINELIDYHSPNDIEFAVDYVIVAATGTYTGTGTWSATPLFEACVLVAYKADTGGGGGSTVKKLAALGVG